MPVDPTISKRDVREALRRGDFFHVGPLRVPRPSECGHNNPDPGEWRAALIAMAAVIIAAAFVL